MDSRGLTMAFANPWMFCHTAAGGAVTREELLNLIRRLPEEKLPKAGELLRSLEEPKPPFKPTPLGGILKGYVFTEADFAEARKEMWGNFGDRIRV
jgi:hypothetical protein